MFTNQNAFACDYIHLNIESSFMMSKQMFCGFLKNVSQEKLLLVIRFLRATSGVGCVSLTCD